MLNAIHSRSLLAVLALALVFLGGAFSEGASAQNGRVVMLGFDGADARTLGALSKANPEAFPNTLRLATEGSFEPLLVEAPPESPVSWAALNTGRNPGETGVLGFVRRKFTNDSPGPSMGHIASYPTSPDALVPIEEFEGTPIPTWSSTSWMMAAGLAAFMLTFLFFKFLLRRSVGMSAFFALVLGVAGAAGGKQLRSWLPASIPMVKNLNQAENFWNFAARDGKQCLVLGAAQAFDMDAPKGAEVLAGFGVPDARGDLGKWFVFTTNPAVKDRQPEGKSTPTSGVVYRLDDYDGEMEGFVYGPANFWRIDQLQTRIDEIAAITSNPSTPLSETIELSSESSALERELKAVKKDPTSVPLAIKVNGNSADVTIDGQTQTIAEGEWSDFYELTFEINPLIQVHAITRARVVSASEPYFEMFLDVLHIDPRKPPFWQPISKPAGLSASLVKDSGLYETYGWPTLTMPFKDSAIAPELLMEDVQFTLEWREKMLRAALARNDWDCLFSVFSTTDRVQHMMYQYYDDQHPLYDAMEADKTFEFFGETIRRRDAIPKIYEQMDRILGVALEALEDDDLFMVCSDHGFQSARNQVHLNNWLAEEGYLVTKPALQKYAYALPSMYCDWSKTKAYSMGMGFIYLNLEGREPKGIVKPEEKEALLAEITEKLAKATDPRTGNKLTNAIYRTDVIHSGEHVASEGDLIVGFAPTYRIGWTASGGGMEVRETESGLSEPAPVVTDNTNNWSGGHVSVAVPDVAGVFLCNRKVTVPSEGVEALHLAPTILDYLGVAIPAEMDNAPLQLP